MALGNSDLVLYCGANMPNGATGTVGGAIDTAARFLDDQWSANAVAALISDGSDTRTATVTGRKADGTEVSDPIVLNGTAEVLGTITFERILSVVMSGADGARSVDLRQGAGGTVRHTINPNEIRAYAWFRNSASAVGSTENWYEKGFMKNNSVADSGLSAFVTLDSDPSGNLAFDLESAKDGNDSSANRKTAPAGFSANEEGTLHAVPGSGDLAPGEAIGVWVRNQLSDGEVGGKSTVPLKIKVNTA